MRSISISSHPTFLSERAAHPSPWGLTEGERGSVVRLIRRFFTHSDSPYGPRTCRKRTGEPDSTTPMPKSTVMCHARVLMKNRFSAGWPRAKCTSQLWIGAANPPLPRGYGHLRFATDTAVPRPAIMGQPGKNLRIKHEMSRFRILAKKSFGFRIEIPGDGDVAM